MSDFPNVTESEMGIAWETFDKMRNAVLEGSRLAQEFETLRTEVQKLRIQLEQVNNYNQTMSESLMVTRKARDDAMAKAAQLERDVATVKAESDVTVKTLTAELEKSQQDLQHAQGVITDRDGEIATLKAELEKSQLSAMEWEEKAENFRKLLDGVKATLSGYTTALGLPQPSPASEPKPVQSAEPSVAQEPAPSPLPESPSSGGSGNSGEGVAPGEWYTDKEGVRRQQPRDPQTQQWRPYSDIGF